MTIVDGEPGHAPGDVVDDSRWILRQRLLGRLTRSVDTPVVVIAGPPGAGKSTLAAQWRRRDGRAGTTVRLGAHSDDPAALAEALVSAVETLGVDVGKTRAAITSVEPTFSAVLLPALGRLAAAPSEPYLIVVDDVHLLRDPACHAVVAAVCDGVPPGSQLALLSRTATPPCLAPARAAGRLLELGPTDLAFDVAEGARLFRGLGAPSDPAEVASAVAATEGWAVALYLSALAAAERGGADTLDRAVVVDGADRHIVDYLRAAVLSTLDESVREFVVRTAILDELTAPLCNAVLQRHDAGRVLPELSDRLLLVVDVDHRRRSFRYHHLFAESLRAELDEREPELVPELHRRAAGWYADHDDLDAALRHAKAAGDPDLAAELMWTGIIPCVTSGVPDRLGRWLDGLSERQISSNRRLALAAAMFALQRADVDVMRHWTQRCEALAGRGWADRASHEVYDAELAVLEGVIGDRSLADNAELVTAAFEGLPADSGFRAIAAFVSGVCLTLLRDVDRGSWFLDAAVRLARAQQVHIIEADALSWQGLLAMLSGDLDRGATLIARATDVIHINHVDRLATAAHCITAQSLALAIRGRRDEAAVMLATARRLTIGMEGIVPWFHVTGRLVQARTAVLLGDGATGRQLIDEARQHMSPDLVASLAQDLLDDTEAALLRLAVEGVQGAPLTNAELRVLQFMPSHMSFPEIGEHLFLSRNTVKTHALAIYRKLGVASRSDAVARAQQLGLVEGSTFD